MNEIQQFLTPLAYAALFFTVLALAWQAFYNLLLWFLSLLSGN